MNTLDPRSQNTMRSSYTPGAQADDLADLSSIFRIFRRRIGLISIVTLLLIAVAVPPILQIKKRYYAESRLLIQSSLVAPEAGDQQQLDISTEVERLLSRTIAERVIRDLKLDTSPEFNPELRPTPPVDQLRSQLRTFLAIETVEPVEDRPMDRIVPAYYGALSVRRNGLSQVVQIGFSSQDPALAAEVPNRLLSIYFEERDRKLRNRVRIAEEYLLGRIRGQRERAGAARAAVKSFRESSGLISGEAQEDATQAISALSGRRAAIIRERAELTATIASSETSSEALETNSALDSAELAELRRLLQMQTLDLLRLQRSYGENHPDVIAAHSQVAETRGAIRREGARQVQALRERLAVLDLEDAAVDYEIGLAQKQLSRLMLSETELSTLIRAAEREQSELSNLEEQRRSVVAQAGLPFVEAEVLSPATPPIYPEGTSRFMYLAGSLIAAATIAFTVACIRELLDNSIRSHRQLRIPGGVRSAGMVPLLRGRRPVRAETDPAFCNAIRTMLLNVTGWSNATGCASLVVTSAVPGEGKSLLSESIADEFSNAGRRVLLVDCNPFGSGNFGFGDQTTPGLADIGNDDDVAQLIRSDPKSGIDYIRAGHTSGATRLLDLRKINQILEVGRERSLFVIFDTGPVLACPEATLLATITDRTLVILRWGKTNRRAAESALARLDSLPCNDVFVAINMVRPKRHALYGFQDFELDPSLLRRAYQ